MDGLFIAGKEGVVIDVKSTVVEPCVIDDGVELKADVKSTMVDVCSGAVVEACIDVTEVKSMVVELCVVNIEVKLAVVAWGSGGNTEPCGGIVISRCA